MGIFNVELKKVVDDSYDIEIGFNLEDKLIKDLESGLVGNIKKFALVTDSNVKELYGEKIYEKLYRKKKRKCLDTEVGRDYVLAFGLADSCVVH